jgi:hypothetical protein
LPARHIQQKIVGTSFLAYSCSSRAKTVGGVFSNFHPRQAHLLSKEVVLIATGKFISHATVAAALLAFTAPLSNRATAATLYNNLSATSNGADPASGSGPLYDSFSTGASAFNLSNFDLLIRASNPNDGGDFNVSVRADNATSPGATIFTSGDFLDSSLSNLPSPIGFSFAPLALAANTRYWIELSSTGSVFWSWSLDVSGLGVANEFFANSVGVSPNNPGGPYQMAVPSLSQTPLPASWTTMLAGLAIFGLLCAHSRRKNYCTAVAAG